MQRKGTTLTANTCSGDLQIRGAKDHNLLSSTIHLGSTQIQATGNTLSSFSCEVTSRLTGVGDNLGDNHRSLPMMPASFPSCRYE
jgi:hypothetical protein